MQNCDPKFYTTIFKLVEWYEKWLKKEGGHVEKWHNLKYFWNIIFVFFYCVFPFVGVAKQALLFDHSLYKYGSEAPAI